MVGISLLGRDMVGIWSGYGRDLVGIWSGFDRDMIGRFQVGCWLGFVGNFGIFGVRIPLFGSLGGGMQSIYYSTFITCIPMPWVPKQGGSGYVPCIPIPHGCPEAGVG